VRAKCKRLCLHTQHWAVPSQNTIQHAVLEGCLHLPVLLCLLWRAQLCCLLAASALNLLLSFGICACRHGVQLKLQKCRIGSLPWSHCCLNVDVWGIRFTAQHAHLNFRQKQLWLSVPTAICRPHLCSRGTQCKEAACGLTLAGIHAYIHRLCGYTQDTLQNSSVHMMFKSSFLWKRLYLEKASFGKG